MSLAARLFLEALRFDLRPEDEVRRTAERALALGAGGFVVFGGDAELVARRIEEWRGSVRHRLWVASDLERGPGQQFRGLPELPPPAGLAASPDPESAARVAGRITGRGARAVGVDLVLAPVLDLDVEPRNPIVGTRSFGPDPEVAGRLGRAWIEACQLEGAAACAKHFPGHGRTTADSHEGLPRVAAGRAELEEDLGPFAAVADVVAGMMTAHVAYPALGSGRPATLEPRILEELLRERFGFEGIVVTDAMNMSGFADPAAIASATGGDDPTGAAAALLAGCDLLLYPADLEAAAGALDRAAMGSARVGDRIEESLRRIEETARRVRPAGGGARPTLGEDMDGLAARTAREAVRIAGRPPAWLAPNRPLRVATVWDDRTPPSRRSLGEPFREELRARGWRVAEEDDGGRPVLLLVASTPQAWKGTASLTEAGRGSVAGIRAAAPATWPVALGHERLLPELGDGSGVVAWGTEETMERAAAARLDETVRAERDAG